MIFPIGARLRTVRTRCLSQRQIFLKSSFKVNISDFRMRKSLREFAINYNSLNRVGYLFIYVHFYYFSIQ